MANLDKIEALFNEVVEKYNSAARAREMSNAVRFNEYDREIDNIRVQVNAYKRRFQEALDE